MGARRRPRRTSAAGTDCPGVAGIPIAVKDVFCTEGITNHGGVADPRAVRPAVRLHAVGPAEGGRRRPGRQDELRRVRDGLLERELGVRSGAQPVGPGHGSRRLVRRLGRGRGGRRGGVGARAATPGGSVRQPAALCGVVGLKPTYGRISRYGLIAFASSLDHVGTFARSVRDTATLLSAIAGNDPMDATSLPDGPADYGAGLEAGVAGMRVGVVEDWLSLEGTQPAVREAFDAGLRALEGLGATVQPVKLPHADYALSAYYLIAPAEASSNLARYDGVRYGLRVGGAGDVVEMNMETRGRGLRRRGEAPHHPGDVRAVGRLLRRVLRAGAEGPHAGDPGLRAGVRRRRRHRGADVADDGVPHRRARGRPAGDVPVGRVHDPGGPGGHPGDQHPVRAGRRGAAGRVPADGEAARRGDGAADGARAGGGAGVLGAAAAARPPWSR